MMRSMVSERVHGVQRREHEVARLGRAQGGVDGLLVAHLADQDHVRVLAQDAPQRALEDAVSCPTSRWLTIELRSRCRNSIGSSIVTMCLCIVG